MSGRPRVAETERPVLRVFRLLPDRGCSHEDEGRPHRTAEEALRCYEYQRVSHGAEFVSVTWNHREYNRAWRIRKADELAETYGRFCGANAPLGWGCGKNGRTLLQRAHLYPTKLAGPGRGSYARLLDARRNPLAYCLLCRKCHDAFDLWRERWERENP